ncbi:MAG: sugar nucleotide-binding protein [Candidatus Lokiarchaeota archaeon]|nr:sugar nucleotide-binding protein [Candidatus Lokiarchaeota archaeon]
MEKILLLGANGFLGSYLIDTYLKNTPLQEAYSLIGADLENFNIPNTIPFQFMDMTDKNLLNEQLRSISPEIIILTAAMTDVDGCENEKEKARLINFEGPQEIANISKRIGSKLVFLSTDFVFDGIDRQTGYNETDIPNPLSYYAQTKFHAELAIMYSEIDFLICRTAVLYGWNSNKLNFITWILNELKQENEIKITTTQYNSPTYVKNLADIIFTLIRHDTHGIFHTAGDSILSRYEMVLKCADVFDYNPNLVIPIKDFKQKARRPEFAGLDISKLRAELSDEITISSLEDGLIDMKQQKVK